MTLILQVFLPHVPFKELSVINFRGKLGNSIIAHSLVTVSDGVGGRGIL